MGMITAHTQRVVHPVNTLRHRVARSIIEGGEIVHKTHHSVGGCTAGATGDGHLGHKTTAGQGMRACRNTVLSHRKRGERLRCRNRNRRNHQKHQMEQTRSLCGQAGMHPKIGSPWVPGYPTDLSSVTANFQHCVGAGSPSMAADRTTAGRISPQCERVGVAPWRRKTKSPSDRGRSAVFHIFCKVARSIA